MLDWTRLTPAVDRAASIAASNFPAHHDVSDIKQEIWVWIMEKKPFIQEVLTRENGEQTLVGIMVKVAQSALKKEDAATYGYAEEDRFFYSVDLIKSILEVIFRYEDWQSFAMSQDTQPKAKSEPATGGNNLASYADVKSAVEKLPEDYYNLIVWRYKYQYTFTMIGEQTGTTKQSVSERHERAVKAIQALLGQQPLGELRRGYDGRTEARGNASGQARIERDYEG
jgi:DNA-directed RNA polymerase specialized sigma24 family protein